jgi:prepilin-type N-terminal cleavage/methylation domain-containing protein
MKRGFTLVELVVVLGIMAIMIGLGVYSATRVKVRENQREVLRMATSLAMEARGAALQLGSAVGTRVQLDPNGSCTFPGNPFGIGAAGCMGPPPTCGGRSALYFQIGVTAGPGCSAAAPCDLATVVTDVQRAAGGATWAGDAYTIFCTSYEMRGKFQSGNSARDVVQLDPTPANWIGFTAASANSYFITYDDRGFAQVAAGSARVPFLNTANDTQNANYMHGVVVLGSGLSCLEGPQVGGISDCARN